MLNRLRIAVEIALIVPEGIEIKNADAPAAICSLIALRRNLKYSEEKLLLWNLLIVPEGIEIHNIE